MVLLRKSLINLSAKIQFATSVYFCYYETKIEMKKSLRESLNMTGLPMVELEIQGKKFWFIVDTGSNVNLISSGLMCEFGKTLISVGSLSTSGLGGHAEEGAVYWLPYVLGGRQFSDQFSVVPDCTFQVIEEEYGVNIKGLVGTSFMLFHRVIIDLSEGVIHLCVKPDEVRNEMRNPA